MYNTLKFALVPVKCRSAKCVDIVYAIHWLLFTGKFDIQCRPSLLPMSLIYYGYCSDSVAFRFVLCSNYYYM